MLDRRNLYIYVVDRDFGFAPNPFHGYCTLATCKPGIRNSAKIGDWVMGVGGSRLKATGKCIYLMEITEISTFEIYWLDKRFQIKKPARNGSSVMMVGDNIYHKDTITKDWIQEDSHHSRHDGSVHSKNLKTDTKSSKVLISEHFLYFGSTAPVVNFEPLGYKNGRNYRKISFEERPAASFIYELEKAYKNQINKVIADPYQLEQAEKRVDQSSGRIS